MRLQRYLKEKFFTAIDKGLYTEVYENPNSKDWANIGSDSVRFIIDFKDKKVYVWDDHKAIHYDVIQHVIGMNYSTFHQGMDNDRYFMGLQNTDKSIESDLYNSLADSTRFERTREMLMKHDTKWLNRYGINGNAVKKMIENPKYRVR